MVQLATGWPTDQRTNMFFWGTHGSIGGSKLTEIYIGRFTLCFTAGEMRWWGLGQKLDGKIVPTDCPDATDHKTVTAGKGVMFGVLSAIRSRFIQTVRDERNMHHTAVEWFPKKRWLRPEALRMIETVARMSMT